MALVVGLGNPEDRFTRTRHNVGFMVADRLAERHEFRIRHREKRALTGSWVSSNGRVLVAEPQTYMNLSGASVRALSQFYKISPDRVLVVCDDTALPFGRLRIRRAGSEGGHNGLRSLSQHLGTQEYPRLRIGIGRPASSQALKDYVLSAFTSTEMSELPAILDRAVDAIETAVSEGVDAAMTRFNGA
ncbi:MAG TPA: aminoacyl-tRNA hydrolase [Armatimonadota bacterium]|nr:aminoacyl-tRNA hydrolase [Armatimonadota bacterium]